MEMRGILREARAGRELQGPDTKGMDMIRQPAEIALAPMNGIGR